MLATNYGCVVRSITHMCMYKHIRPYLIYLPMFTYASFSLVDSPWRARPLGLRRGYLLLLLYPFLLFDLISFLNKFIFHLRACIYPCLLLHIFSPLFLHLSFLSSRLLPAKYRSRAYGFHIHNSRDDYDPSYQDRKSRPGARDPCGHPSPIPAVWRTESNEGMGVHA